VIPASVRVDVAGVARDLVVREVAPGVHLGILLLACDPELTEAAGRALAAHVPPGAVLVMPDGKAQALLHVVQRETGRPAVLFRKERKSYLVEPVLEVRARSITTDREHSFYLGDDQRALLDGQVVVFLDDVVSTGQTMKALRDAMISRCGAREVRLLAVATEGEVRVELADVVSLVRLPVFRGEAAAGTESTGGAP